LNRQQTKPEFHVAWLGAFQKEKQLFLCSGKVPCHISLAVQQFLAKNQIPPILLSQHSPDITACDFWVFLRLRIGLKGNCLHLQKKFSRTQQQVLHPS